MRSVCGRRRVTNVNLTCGMAKWSGLIPSHTTETGRNKQTNGPYDPIRRMFGPSDGDIEAASPELVLRRELVL